MEQTENQIETAEPTVVAEKPAKKAAVAKLPAFKPKKFKVGSAVFIEVMPEELTIVTDKKHILFQNRAIMPLKEDMVISVLEHGIKKPPLLRQVDDSKDGDEVYEVWDGRQRVRAACEANRRLSQRGDKPRVIVCRVDTGNVESNVARVESLLNEHVIPPDPISRAEAMAKSLSVGLTKIEVAQDFWTSQKTVDRHMALLRLCKDLQQAVREDKVTMMDALELGKGSQKAQKEALERLEKGEPLFLEAPEEGEEGEEGEAEAKPTKKKAPKAASWKKTEPMVKRLKAWNAPSAAKQEKADIIATVIQGLYGATKKAAREFEELLEDLGFSMEDAEEEESKPKGKKAKQSED